MTLKLILRYTLPLSFLVFVGCSSDSTHKTGDSGAETKQDCDELEPENPYQPGSGHHAGFEWAEKNNPSSCGGNSNSFIEGCEEYQRQEEAYDSCLSKR